MYVCHACVYVCVTTYLTQGTQNVILIILIGSITNTHKTIESTQRHKGMHQVFVLLEDLLQ